MMGSTHTYEIGKGRAPVKGKEAAVEMALNPEDLDLMDSETMALKAEAALRYLRIKNFKLNVQKSPAPLPLLCSSTSLEDFKIACLDP